MVGEPTPSLLIDRLASHPARLLRALTGLTDATWRTRPAPDSWSPTEIVAHLRASDDIVAPRCLAILARDLPPLTAFDERRWAEVAGYTTATPDALVAGLAARRAELVAALRLCTAGDWDRTGQHETAGRRTLLQVVTGLVEHEDEHCAQLERLAGQAH